MPDVRPLAEPDAAAAAGRYDTALDVWGRLGHAGAARAQAEIGRCFAAALGVHRDADLAPSGCCRRRRPGTRWHSGCWATSTSMASRARLTTPIAEEWYARAERSPFADRFYAGVRAGCTPAPIAEAEARADAPLAPGEVGP